MSSVLFVVPPFAGHVNPAIGVASELERRGHRIGWAGSSSLLSGLVPPGQVIYPCDVLSDVDRPPELRGFAALEFLWDSVLLPLADAMVAGVEEAVAVQAPDLIVVDQQALAGAMVAERIGVPWVTSATTSSELADPLAATPKVRAWLDSRLAGLRARLGDPAATGDPRFSPHLVLAFTTAALAGDASGPVRFVGPVVRPAVRDGFPWEWLDPLRPLVFVSLGTLNAEVSGPFLEACLEALRARVEYQAVIVDPAGALAAESVPAHVLVRRSVPQTALLEHADAVVCHAGHNTVCEALWEGVPLVVAPIRDDQPIVAGQVVDAGAGVRLRFGRAGARHIDGAVRALLEESGYRAAARRIRDEFRAAGGATAAADAVESLLTRTGIR
ncbi:MGT family glycosyltransferase [Herbihabitans rhizosphaerae]|uniref:MGT family glycosyltransferase n=1 Tax=Herbihabitans rhizosphaerae TaxID=1872711 RepID=A0A4Q7KIQ8_9PSEU|nr:nucleotide disphospho-sugar-binding domain-containing protein [Herbihabitans rhizosphaerae]RZS34105.1 MGT family glycosyltransferase [Herbihabitans rhizosphaerae]